MSKQDDFILAVMALTTSVLFGSAIASGEYDAFDVIAGIIVILILLSVGVVRFNWRELLPLAAIWGAAILHVAIALEKTLGWPQLRSIFFGMLGSFSAYSASGLKIMAWVGCSLAALLAVLFVKYRKQVMIFLRSRWGE